ncbi:glycosyl hydrolase family 18 protein [Salinibius halmophilus]|uniref:glycosyl hydrolase family 18 protein n=1 Tax=Salinibius halmophilus TaxID=1853216 RepID=UPI000E669312|nr:glycosyl hydrolase family 18 protein [Salinibius halmophilus]
MKALNKLSVILLTGVASISATLAQPWQQDYNYQGGEVVENQDARYECKPFPYNGWCGLSAYEPGVGFAWTDAWTLVGSTVTATPVVTPTPTSLCGGVNVPDTRYDTKTIAADMFAPYLELPVQEFFGTGSNPSAGVSVTYPDGSSEVIASGTGTMRLTTDMNGAKFTYSYIYPGTQCPVTEAVVTLAITQLPTMPSMPEFILGSTDPETGDVYAYQGQCWEAKNNPGAWETPREGWFWTQVSCSTTPVVSCPPLAVPTPLDTYRNETLTSGAVKRIKVTELLGNVDLASVKVQGDAFLDGDEVVLNSTNGTVTVTQRFKFDACRGGEYSDSYSVQRVFINVSVEPVITTTPTCLPIPIAAPIEEYIKITDPVAPGYSVNDFIYNQGRDISTIRVETYGDTTVSRVGETYYVDGVGAADIYISKYIGHPEKGCPGYTVTDRLTVEVQPAQTAKTPVIAYQPSWAFNLNAIQWDKLTHINYSFALPDADGSLKIEAPQNLQALSDAAVGKDTEIWLAIGGWTIGDGGGNDADWSTITQNPQLLERFKGEIQTAIDTYNLDGIDIDWEWPNNNTEKALYLQLMQELDAMLEPQGKGLSTAVISRGFNGQYVDARVFELVDYFNLMAYDDNWPWSGDNKHSDMGVAQASLDYWINQRGAPADKVILGVPFYCRGNNQAISYEQLLANGADPDADAHQGCYYNGRVTMKQKAELAKQRAAGVMFWELSQDVEDDRSLLTVIDSVLNP